MNMLIKKSWLVVCFIIILALVPTAVPTAYAVGQPVSSDQPNLVANYDADLNDLQLQILEMNSDYINLKNELISIQSIDLERQIILVDELAGIEDFARKRAESLLKLRYTEDRTELRPEVFTKFEAGNDFSVFGEHDPNPPSRGGASLIYPNSGTYATGNFGDKSGTNGSFSHIANNNRMTLSHSSLLPTGAFVHSGMVIVPYIPYPQELISVDFRFRQVEAKGLVLCSGSKFTSANANISMNIYNISTNEYVNQYIWKSASCSGDLDGGAIEEGSTMLYMNNVTINNRYRYYVYLELSGYSFNSGNVNFSTEDHGMKWSFLEANIN
ncbi:hypothetical protein EBB07_22435 [Paenibacillaceae bacterium]|nr:hypothetical protein EBB07_22435 [Paenibacillaceae bacterium]